MEDLKAIDPKIQTWSKPVLLDAPSLITLNSKNPDIAIVTPSSPNYSEVHREYNAYNTALPLAIVLPSNIEQLAVTIKYCTSQLPPIPMTVRGGGHDAYGRNVLVGAVQLDLRLLKWTRILQFDPRSASQEHPSSSSSSVSISVGPGTVAIEMLRVLDAAGLAAPTGWVGSVGVTGWACGGGYGLAAGMWGLGVDNIMGARLITPLGDLVDTDDDPELLWAVRGAGLGNFGVICDLRLRVYPKPDKYLAGFLAFPLAEGLEVLEGFQRMSDGEAGGLGIPPNFSGELTVNSTTQVGATIKFLFTWICDGEEVEAGWAHLAKLKALGTVVLDTVTESMSSSDESSMDLCSSHGASLACKNPLSGLSANESHTRTASILDFHELMYSDPSITDYGYTTMNSLALARLSPELIRAIMDHPPPLGGASAILLHHSHNRAVQLDPTAAWAHRDKHYILSPCGFAGLDATLDEREVPKRWSDELFKIATDAGRGLDKAYWSMTHPRHCDAGRVFGKESVRRLKALKQKYNSQNAFPAASPVLTQGQLP